MDYSIEQSLEALEKKGVNIPDPRQVYVSPDVDIARIYPGSVLYPGTRLTGSRTLIGSGAKIGTEGPATVNDSVIGAGASIASGYVAGSTLLPRASVGGSCHLRAGTLLEEEANTAHAVGLKQTIMMYGVTMGSLINFCDALLSGGLSRKVHTERCQDIRNGNSGNRVATCASPRSGSDLPKNRPLARRASSSRARLSAIACRARLWMESHYCFEVRYHVDQKS